MIEKNISQLIQHFPNNGELLWIGLRPARKKPMISVEKIEVGSDCGLIGDHYAGRNHKRQVTMFQWEHIAVLESFTGKSIAPEMLRRNLLIRGINLLTLQKQIFQIGSTIFKTTGLCHPCSRMENILGHGGYNAMRNHGGITTQIIQSGQINIGDELIVLNKEEALSFS